MVLKGPAATWSLKIIIDQRLQKVQSFQIYVPSAKSCRKVELCGRWASVRIIWHDNPSACKYGKIMKSNAVATLTTELHSVVRKDVLNTRNLCFNSDMVALVMTFNRFVALFTLFSRFHLQGYFSSVCVCVCVICTVLVTACKYGIGHLVSRLITASACA